MVCIAVNKDGTEIICERELIRFIPGNQITHAVCSIKVLQDNKPCWIPKITSSECGTYGLRVNIVTLPKGSIKKLIGKELTWEDDCIVLNNIMKVNIDIDTLRDLLKANGWEEYGLHSLRYDNLVADVYNPNRVEIYLDKSNYAQNGGHLFTITKEDQLNKFLDFLNSLRV